MARGFACSRVRGGGLGEWGGGGLELLLRSVFPNAKLVGLKTSGRMGLKDGEG